jgi:hypothetical protein
MSQLDQRRDTGKVDTRTRIFIVVVAALLGVIVGLVAALLVWADGSSIPRAILYGGGTFAGTVTLILLMVGAVRSL